MNNTIKREYINPTLVLYKCKGVKENKINSRGYNKATNITLNEKIGDIDELTFNIPWSDDRKISYDDCEKLIKFKDRYFIIKNINLTDETTGEMTVTCYSEEIELKGVLCQTINLIGVSPEEMFNTIFNKTLFPELVTQYHWKGTDVASTKLRQLQVDTEVSVYENLMSMAKVFDGWLEFTTDSSGDKWVYLRTQSINNQKYLKKSLDLEKLNLEYDSNDIFTRLYVYGATNSLTNEPLNIMGVNPTGKAYLEDFSFYTSKGISESIVKSEAKYLQIKTITLDDYTDENKLYEAGLEELAKCCIPQLTASIDILDLSILEENDGLIEPPKIGYTVTCMDKNTNFILSCMVTEVKRNFDKPYETTVDIANYIKYDTVLKSLERTSSVVNNTVSKNTDGETVIKGNSIIANGEDLNNKINEIGKKQANTDISIQEINRELNTQEQKISTLTDKININSNQILNINNNIQNIEDKLREFKYLLLCGSGTTSNLTKTISIPSTYLNKIDTTNGYYIFVQVMNGQLQSIVKNTDNFVITTSVETDFDYEIKGLKL